MYYRQDQGYYFIIRGEYFKNKETGFSVLATLFEGNTQKIKLTNKCRFIKFRFSQYFVMPAHFTKLHMHPPMVSGTTNVAVPENFFKENLLGDNYF